MPIESILSTFFILLIIIFLGTLLIVGSFLIIRAYKIKALGFYFSGIAWLLMAFAQILNQLFDTPVMIYAIFSKTSFVLLVIFTNLTFHKARKTFLTKLILVGSIIFGIFAWSFDSIRMTSQLTYILSRIFDFIQGSISLDWLAISCYLAYKNIKYLEIAPWIKVRYKITYIGSSIFSLFYLILIFHPYDLPFGDTSTILGTITFGLTSILAISYSIAYALAWIMPNRVKKFYNRGYQPIEEEEMTEEELMKRIREQLTHGNS